MRRDETLEQFEIQAEAEAEANFSAASRFSPLTQLFVGGRNLWEDNTLCRRREMVHHNEACEMCTRTCMLIHGQRDPSPIISSFFKVMIDKRFSKVLYFPPRFARLVSHLTDQETYLEDSSGQRWRVGICNNNGSLAIRQGWHTFSSEHGLKMGDFLVFHYIQGQHFVVQIYGTSGCQKINSYNGTRTGKKRPRTNSAATSHDELSPETDINLRKKWNSTPSVTAVPESERDGHQPVTTTFASNIDANNGERQIVPQEEGTSDVPQGENRPHNHTDSISQRESSSVDGAPREMEFLTLKAPFLDVQITQTDKISGPVNDISVLGQTDENGHHVGLISSTSLKSAENGSNGSHLVCLYNKESHCTSNNQVTTEKSDEASQFSKETRVDKLELKEMAAKTHCPSKKLNANAGKEPKVTEKDGQDYPEAIIGNNKAIKSEPADSGDTSFPDASNFSCSLRVDGRNFLELPQSWPQVLVGRKKLGRCIVYLKGPDNRRWPVIYHENFGSKILAGNWALFTAVYGLKPGDECLFQLSDQSIRMFTVHVAHKVDVTQTTLS
ncbi:B3 domain-containing protein Os01g0905400-like isoform X3 [Solanum dulcamara]|uniref:B3 domain-containing protein Os01g0905400-like isoform X3 n=1 Tax=Solanum dulcamara TaxID=45834 RepID=UPI0024860C42|nr:B3 domain-containing protein Os01g0905400-like isoform X3 [Solanum dulcamara]